VEYNPPSSRLPVSGSLIISIKPEDDDDEAKRRMNEEMRGLICGTSFDDPVTIPHENAPRIPTKSEVPSIRHFASSVARESSSVSCKVCTTEHLPPVPLCCDTCANVLDPENLVPGKTWVCQNPHCHGRELGYVNSLDAGRCGLCQARKSE